MKEVSKHQARTPHMEKRKAHNGKRQLSPILACLHSPLDLSLSLPPFPLIHPLYSISIVHHLSWKLCMIGTLVDHIFREKYQ